MQSGEATLPGFVHDLMATNLNLFAGSAFHGRYGSRLAAHGLNFALSEYPVCSVFPDAGFVGISTNLEETLESIRAVREEDAPAFSELYQHFGRVSPHLFPLLGVPMPSWKLVRTLLASSRKLGRNWPLEITRLVLQSPRQFVEEHFGSEEVRALVAAWGMHLDFAPDTPGGALFPFLETMVAQDNGMVIGAGGASSMIEAMVGLLHELGGEVVCGTSVDEVIVEDGRAVGVRAEGRRISASKAVIANLTPPVLFNRLVDTVHLPNDFVAKVGAYRQGPGTLMIHLALSGRVPWVRPEAGRHMYVHVGPYLDDMNLAYQQATAGLIPIRPTLVVGQPTVPDPTRAPEGKHVLWIQARMMPGRIAGDAAEKINVTDWEEAKSHVADRVMSQLETYAPGLEGRVLARHVLSPADLEASNPNLAGGDSLGGSHQLMQHFFLRPFPGWTRYRTPVPGLFMCGSGTWPGAGVGAGSGWLLGQSLASSRRLT